MDLLTNQVRAEHPKNHRYLYQGNPNGRGKICQRLQHRNLIAMHQVLGYHQNYRHQHHAIELFHRGMHHQIQKGVLTKNHQRWNIHHHLNPDTITVMMATSNPIDARIWLRTRKVVTIPIAI